MRPRRIGRARRPGAPGVLVLTLCLALAALPALRAEAAPPANAAPPAPTPATAAPASSDETVVLNFVNADVDAVIRAIGQFTGRTFIIDPRVKGTMTLITEHPVTRQQAFRQLLAALRLQGYALVESAEPGGMALVTPEADAKLQGGHVVTPSKAAPRGDQVLTQVFRLQYESASNLVPVLRPLIAPNNTISAYPANNTLVITDYAENLRRLGRIIEAIDSPATSEVEVVPLKYGLATDVAGVLTRILDEGAARAGQATDAGQRVSVLAEPRTNMLILRTASRARLEQAKQLIARFDQPDLTPGNIKVVYLHYAQAVKLAPLLRAVLSSDPSFIQAATGSGLSVTPMSSTLGQSGTTGTGQPGQNQNQPAAPTGGSNVSGGMSPPGAGGQGGGAAVAGMIQADPATNSLILTAPEPLYRNIRTIIDRLDMRPAQVMIESLVVELSGTAAAEFGIQWQALSGLSSNSTKVIGGTNFTSGQSNLNNAANTNITSLAANLGAPAPGLNVGIVKGTITLPGTNVQITNLGVLARALQSLANTNILSRPNIQTLDNEEGKFLVGQNIGLLTGAYATAASTTTTAAGINPFQTYDRRDVGLQLAIKPQISEGGTVRLAIYIEDSSIAAGTSATNPVLNKRSFETNVLVEDGSFVVISGLIQDQADETQNKVPVLGDIPFLGRLFRYDSRDHIKTQTMVFLRPTIIRSEDSAAELAIDRYDYIRAQLKDTRQPDLPPLPDMSLQELPPAPLQARPRVEPKAGAGATTEAPSVGDAASAHPPAGLPAPAAPAAGGAVSDAGVAAAVQVIQIAAPRDAGAARQMQRRLKDSGIDAYLESVRTLDGEVVRVRVSVERRGDNVAAALSRLRGLGFDPVPVSPVGP